MTEAGGPHGADLPRAVLWDMDGTLVDTEPYWMECEFALAERYGGTWSHEHGLAVVGGDLLDSARYIREHMGIDRTPEQIRDELLDGVIERVRREVPWRPGARELLAALVAAQVPCALVTMSYRRFADPVIQALPEGTFRASVVGDEVSQGKPHPEAYQRAAELLEVDPGECVALEDSNTGVASALAAGCRTIAVPCHVPMREAPGLHRLETLSGVTPQRLQTVAVSRTSPARSVGAVGRWGAGRERSGYRVRVSEQRQETRPGSFRVFSVAGVGVYVNQSWILIAALLTWMVSVQVEGSSPGLGPLRFVVAFGFVALFWLSLLAHELAHALAGRRLGRGVRSITLHFFGGATEFDGPARSAGASFWVSVVGPLTTLAVALLAWLASLLAPEHGVLSDGMANLAWINLLLGVFNLVPGLPLDGGHLLAAGVWKVSGDPDRGVQVAARVGQAVAVLVLLLPVGLRLLLDYRPSLLDYGVAALMAMFLWSGARASLVYARIHSRLPSIRARELARPALAVPPDLPVAEAVRRANDAGAGAVVTHLANDEIEGVVSERALTALPEDRRPWVPVSSVTRSLVEGMSLPAGLSGQELLLAMERTPSTEYLLLEEDGRVYGVLSRSDVEAAFNRGR